MPGARRCTDTGGELNLRVMLLVIIVGAGKLVLAALPYIAAAATIVGGTIAAVNFLSPDACEAVCAVQTALADSCAIGCGAD